MVRKRVLSKDELEALITGSKIKKGDFVYSLSRKKNLVAEFEPKEIHFPQTQKRQNSIFDPNLIEGDVTFFTDQ